MKKRNLLTVIVLLSLFTMLSSPVQAADAYAYFENPENYDAYNAGNGKIHVKLLVFGEKGDYNYNAGRGQNRNLENEYDPTPDATGSRLYTERTDLTNDRTVQLYYWGDNYYNRSAVVRRPARTNGRKTRVWCGCSCRAVCWCARTRTKVSTAQ